MTYPLCWGRLWASGYGGLRCCGMLLLMRNCAASRNHDPPTPDLATMRNLLFCWFCFILLPASADAATIDNHAGWMAWMNSYKFDARWSLISDVQLRSDDGWSELQNLLVRPGLSYALAPQSSLALGYAWVGTFNAASGNLLEHRVWQQYLHTQTLHSSVLVQRVRLEQRFVEPSAGENRRFSQRLRYLLRALIPLDSPGEPFVKGPFLVMQDELFLNIQHRDAVNGQIFDQNRAYLAAGYRVSAKWDAELGYLNQHIVTRSNESRNHILQLAISTRF